MKRIYYFLPTMNPGGVEIALAKASPSIREKLDLKIFYIKTRGKIPVNQKHFSFALIEIFRSGLPDTVITSLWPSLVFGWFLSFFGCKWVIFVHSSKFHHKLDSIFHRFFLEKCDEIAVDSEATQSFVNSFVTSVDIPVSVISFYFPRTLEHQYISKNKIKHSFTFVGRVSPVKRLDLVCNLAGTVLTKWSDAQFNFVISGHPPKEVLEVCSKFPDRIRLELEASHEEVLNILDTSHAFVLLSDFEGFSMATLEAALAGCFVIFRDVGSIRRYLLDSYSLCVTETQIVDGSFIDNLGHFELPENIPVTAYRPAESYVQGILRVSA